MALRRARFKDMADGSGAPWLFGIARNLLRQYHKHNRIESAARERLGMPTAWAECEDYEAVDERMFATRRWRRLLRHAVRALPTEQRNARWSCGSCSSWTTRRSRAHWAAARTPRDCVSRAPCARWDSS